MTLEYSLHYKVNIIMFDHIEDFLIKIPSFLKEDSVTAAPNDLFKVGYDAPMLQPIDSKIYYHHVMQILWLAKIICPDLLPLLSNFHDWKKLTCTCKHIHSTRYIPLILDGCSLNSIKWYKDVVFAVHQNMRSHTGMIMTTGKGCIYGASGRQKINTKISTEAELVGVSDTLPQVIWNQNFLRDQGYQINKSINYQDNQSTIRLCNNGRSSSSRRTRYIEIRSFFIKDRIKSYCPTDYMITFFFASPNRAPSLPNSEV